MTKLIQILVCFLAILSVSIICHSCREPAPESDITSIVKCECDDMDCWRKNTTEKSLGAFKCATEVLGLISGSSIASHTKDIAKSLKSITGAMKEQKIDTSFWDKLAKLCKELEKHIQTNNSIATCGKQTLSVLSTFFSFLNSTQKLSFASYPQAASDESVVEQIAEDGLITAKNSATMISFVKSLGKLATSGLSGITDCTTALVKNSKDSKAIGFISVVTPSLKTLLQGLLVFYVLVDCGYQLTTSSAYLLANTKCLLSDLGNLYDSYQLTQKLHSDSEKNAKTAYIDCDEEFEKTTCSDEIEQLFGMAAYDTLSKARIYNTESTYPPDPHKMFCYQYCFKFSHRNEVCPMIKNYNHNLKNPDECVRKCKLHGAYFTHTSKNCVNPICYRFCCKEDNACMTEVRKEFKREYNQ